MSKCETVYDVFQQIYQRRLNYLPLPVWIGKPEFLLAYINHVEGLEREEKFVVVDDIHAIQLEWEPVLASSEKVKSVTFTDKSTISLIDELCPEVVLVPENTLAEFSMSQFMGYTLVVGEMYDFSHDKTDKYKELTVLREKFSRVLGLTRYYPFADTQRLWAQFRLMDGGSRLGKEKQAFYDRFFYKTDNTGSKLLKPSEKEDALDVITSLIADIMIDTSFNSEISDKKYREASFCIEMGRWEKSVYDAMSGVLYGMRREKEKNIKKTISQIADGIVFDSGGKPIIIHERKINILLRLIQSYEDSRIVVFGASKSEVDYIRRRLESMPVGSKTPLYQGWRTSDQDEKTIFVSTDSSEDEIRELECTDMVIWFSQCAKKWQKKALTGKLGTSEDKHHIGTAVYLKTLDTMDCL